MRRKHIIFLSAAAVMLTACMRETFVDESQQYREPLDFEKIQSSVSSPDMGSAGADTLSLTFIVEGSNDATKSAIVKAGGDAVYTCEVRIDGHHAGCNAMSSNISGGTKSIYGKTSTNPLDCNFLRIDENYDSDHTALYTFPTYNHGTLLEGEVMGAPEAASLARSVVLNPEQSYSCYSRKYSETARDTVFYHTRLVGWHPQVCDLPLDGKAVEFGDTRYANYIAYINSQYGIVFNHALDGGADIMMSNLGQAQRWHSNAAPAAGQCDNRYRDLKKQLLDTNYCVPFGYNMDQEPHYSNPLKFKHYLSAVRIWAKVAQDTSGTTLNLTTWGKINSLTFVDQPSTCTIMLPTEVGNSSFGSVLAGSWTDYTNHTAQNGLIYGEGDIEVPIEDAQVSYPIDMTQTQVEMSSKYLGYSLVMPGTDIVIAIQTSAGTYQAVLPYKILESGQTDSTVLFEGGKIYDVVLNLETKGSVAEFIENEDTGSYTDLSPWDPSPDKQEFKTANCYIVDVADVTKTLAEYKTAGSEDVPGYCFLATIIGNGESGIMSKGSVTFHTGTATISTPAAAKVVWQSEKGLVSNVHFQHGYIRFNVPQAKKGNAVIAALDADGKIVWSWHIWITDKPNVITSSQNYNYLDRNLGAITTDDGDVIPDDASEALKLYGLYYQWGRKDPLPFPLKYNQSGGQSMRITPVYNTYGDEITSLGNYIYNQGETIEDAIQRPMHYILNPSSALYNHNWMSEKIDFLWGEEISGVGGVSYYQKSIYDPCPYGYHIPGEEIQYLAETADTIIYDQNNYGLFFNKEKTLFLPYAGYYGPDRNQTSNDGAAYYCGSKGDYQSSVICSDEDGVDYPYFRDHRLRTYISYATAWTEPNVDSKTAFPYNASDNYVTTDVVRTHHDYTNRCTAASVRCVKETNYALNIVARMSANTRAIKKDSDVPVTFTLEGRTNKGVIKSATLVLHYTDTTQSPAAEVTKSINLADSTGSHVVLTSKTLSGYCTVTIPASWTSVARDASVYARLDLVVKQGSKEDPKSSVEYQLKQGFVLTIKLDATGTSTLTPAYCVAEYDSTSVTTESGTEIRPYKTTRFVTSGNMYPPVLGQPTTLTVYVNAEDATVTIGEYTATRTSNIPTQISGENFYPYSVKSVRWSVKGEKPLDITATKFGYGVAEESLTVPVYGFTLGDPIKKASDERGLVTKNQWYVIWDDYWTAENYIYFNGLNIHNDLESGDMDYRFLFGFSGATTSSKIYTGLGGANLPLCGNAEGDKVKIADNEDGGYTYQIETYSGSDDFINIKAQYTKKILSRTYTYDTYWDKKTNAFVGGGTEEYVLKDRSDWNRNAFWLYPVTFTLN